MRKCISTQGDEGEEDGRRRRVAAAEELSVMHTRVYACEREFERVRERERELEKEYVELREKGVGGEGEGEEGCELITCIFNLNSYLI